MPLSTGRTGPNLFKLVDEISSTINRAADYAISTKGLLAANLTIGVSVLHEVYTLCKIALDYVDSKASTSGIEAAWQAIYVGQTATVAADWAATRTALVNLGSAIWGVLPKSADNSVLIYMPNDGSQNNVARTMTLTTAQRTSYNGYCDALTATLR